MAEEAEEAKSFAQVPGRTLRARLMGKGRKNSRILGLLKRGGPGFRCRYNFPPRSHVVVDVINRLAGGC